MPIVAEYNLESIQEAGLTPAGYLSLYRELGYAVHLIKRPLIGRYRWKDLHPVEDERGLPALCNIVLLDGND